MSRIQGPLLYFYERLFLPSTSSLLFPDESVAETARMQSTLEAIANQTQLPIETVRQVLFGRILFGKNGLVLKERVSRQGR